MTLPQALAIVVACSTTAGSYRLLEIARPGCDGEDTIPEALYLAAVDVIRASAQQTARNQ